MNKQEFFDRVARSVPEKGIRRINMAYEISKKFHYGQKRDEGGRYFDHPVAVAIIALDCGEKDPEQIVVDLLHDVEEDCFPWEGMLRALFGIRTARRLRLISRWVPVYDTISGAEFKRNLNQRISDKEYYRNVASDRKVLKAKFADRIHNFRTMHAVRSVDRQHEYIEEGEKYLLPLARNKKGMLEKSFVRELVIQKRRLKIEAEQNTSSN
jgi:GTP diphosphokinase / guanosine-3',5'-bis(diphosphate) 3'-diphosphatase